VAPLVGATEFCVAEKFRDVPLGDMSTCNAWETGFGTRSNTPGKSP
jgi:hypothetical protein